MSVGGFPYSQVIQDAVNNAWNKGAVLMGRPATTAARRRSTRRATTTSSASARPRSKDEFSHWSSYGPKVDVSAPGSSVLTTNCTRPPAITIVGLSHVHQRHELRDPERLRRRRPDGALPGQHAAQIVNRLLRTVDDLGYRGREDRYGLGRVNAFRALGATVAQPSRRSGDAMERNNSRVGAVRIAKGSTTQATIYPAGDVDWFSVRASRAGRIDVRVTGRGRFAGISVESERHPGRSDRRALQQGRRADQARRPRMGERRRAGAALRRPGYRVYVRVLNYYASGNRKPYSVKPTFVDTVPPVVTIDLPVNGATGVTQWVTPIATFSEAVRTCRAGRSACGTWPRTRSSPHRCSTIPPPARPGCGRLRGSSVATTIGSRSRHLTDQAGGNALATTRARFSTSSYTFRDIQGTPSPPRSSGSRSRTSSRAVDPSVSARRRWVPGRATAVALAARSTSGATSTTSSMTTACGTRRRSTGWPRPA